MRSSPRRRAVHSLLLALLAGACTVQTEPPKPASPSAVTSAPSAREEILAEDAYRLLLRGQAAGHQIERTARIAGGNIRSILEQAMTVRRERTPLTTSLRLEVEETEAGAIVSFHLEVELSANKTVTRGVVRGDQLEITTEVLERRRQATVPFDPAARGPWFIERRCREELRREGDRLEVITLLPDLQKCSRATFTRGPEDTVEIDGEPIATVRRTATLAVMPGAELIHWVDAAHRSQRIIQRLPGLEIELLRASPTDLEATEPARAPEIFLATSVTPDRDPGDPRAPSIRYRLSLKKGDFESLGLAGSFGAAGQSVTPGATPDRRVLRIERVPPGSAVPLPLPPAEELEPYLRAGPLIQSDAPEILDRARELLEGVSEAHAAARRLERFVFEHITRADLSTGFASAVETLRNRQGDCTEHGMLLAALARAAGLPARIVTGLVYHRGRFVGHLWTEVYTDRWIPLDATRPDLGVGITHIGFSTTALESAEGLATFLELASLLGNLEIEVLEGE